MAIAGLKLITLALRDKETGELLTGETGLSENGLFPVTTKMLGAKSANISNISAKGTAVYGNNTKVDQTQTKGEPSIALTSMTYHSTLSKSCWDVFLTARVAFCKVTVHE